MVGLRVLERCLAQRARSIQDAQRSSLGAVREACLAPEEQPYTISADDHRGDGADAGPAADRLHWQPESSQTCIDDAVVVAVAVEEGLFIDQHRHVGHTGSTGLSLGDGDQRFGGEEVLAFERVGRCVVGRFVVEQGFDRGPQPSFELATAYRVELSGQVPHSVGVGPPPQP